MNSPRFDRFAQPQFLQRIGRERLTQILLPFATELLVHGISLPATALPDEIFFVVLTALARRPEGLSAPLLDAMMAVEVINDVFPDEVSAPPLVVSELRVRLGARQRPILLMAGPYALSPDSGRDAAEGVEVAALAPHFVVAVADERQREPVAVSVPLDLVSAPQTSSALRQPSPVAPRHPLPSDGRGASPAFGGGDGGWRMAFGQLTTGPRTTDPSRHWLRRDRLRDSLKNCNADKLKG